MKAFIYQRGKTALTSPNYSDFSFCKDMFEKYGVLRQFRRSECFVHSGDVMEYVGWIVSGGFKYSLTASYGIDKRLVLHRLILIKRYLMYRLSIKLERKYMF